MSLQLKKYLLWGILVGSTLGGLFLGILNKTALSKLNEESLGGMLVKNITTQGSFTATGNASSSFGNALVPMSTSTNNFYDIGEPNKAWRNIYASGTAYLGNVTVIGTCTGCGSGSGSGATAALDNLASVAINTSLISDTDVTDDLGSNAKKWRTLYVNTISASGTIRQSVADANAFSILSTDSEAFSINSADPDNPIINLGGDGVGIAGTVSLFFRSNVRSARIELQNPAGNGLFYVATGGHSFSDVVFPDVDNQDDLGLTTNRWKDLYLGGNIDTSGTIRKGRASINNKFVLASSSSTPAGQLITFTSSTLTRPPTFISLSCGDSPSGNLLSMGEMVNGLNNQQARDVYNGQFTDNNILYLNPLGQDVQGFDALLFGKLNSIQTTSTNMVITQKSSNYQGSTFECHGYAE